MLEHLLYFGLITATSVSVQDIQLHRARPMPTRTKPVKVAPGIDITTAKNAASALSKLLERYHINTYNEISNKTYFEQHTLAQVEFETNQMPDTIEKEAHKQANIAWRKRLEDIEESARIYANRNRVTERDLIQQLEREFSSSSVTAEIVTITRYDLAMIDKKNIDPLTRLPKIIAMIGCQDKYNELLVKYLRAISSLE